MLDTFFISLEAVLSIFLLIGFGLVVRLMKLLDDKELVRVNKMVFTIFFFTMMFNNMYRTNIGTLFQPRLIAFTIFTIILTIAVSGFFVLRAEKDDRRRGVMIQAIFRSNFVLMGVPLAANLCGDDNIAVTTMMIAITVPLYNFAGVIVLEYFRGGRADWRKMFIDVLKNSMILGAMCGALFLVLGIKLPSFIMRPVGQIAASGTPIALVLLGASFRLGSVKEHLPQLSACIFSKLVLVPAIVLCSAYALGFRGIEFVTLISIFATPCAVAGYMMAQQVNADAELAGNAVVFSSAFSVFTLFSWIFLWKTIGAF